MKINLYTICWNEEFMLPQFMKHYDFVDKIIVYDNGSTDNSINLIQSNPKCELRHYDTHGEQDNLEMRRVKNECWKGDDADWVIVCDVDEFLIGYDILPNYGEKVVFKPEGWQMCGADGMSIDQIKMGYREPMFDKSVCFSPKIQEINYCCGGHTCEPVGGNIVNAMKLYHYSWLGEEYVVNRWKRYAARMSQQDIDNGWGFQYRLAEEEIRSLYRNACAISKEI